MNHVEYVACGTQTFTDDAHALVRWSTETTGAARPSDTVPLLRADRHALLLRCRGTYQVQYEVHAVPRAHDTVASARLVLRARLNDNVWLPVCESEREHYFAAQDGPRWITASVLVHAEYNETTLALQLQNVARLYAHSDGSVAASWSVVQLSTLF